MPHSKVTSVHVQKSIRPKIDERRLQKKNMITHFTMRITATCKVTVHVQKSIRATEVFFVAKIDERRLQLEKNIDN